jgi:hypothetical protein
MDRGMTMQTRMQCTFMAQNEDDANQCHSKMRMMMLTKQIESTERLIKFKMKMLERMGVDSFDGINNLMDKLEQMNVNLEIMMGEVQSINPIVGKVLENAAKSMGLTVTTIPNITNRMGVDSLSKVDDLLDDA